MLNKPSGNFEPEPDNDDEPLRSKRWRVKRRAEDYSLREVGNLDAVDSFLAQAEGEVKWQDLE